MKTGRNRTIHRLHCRPSVRIRPENRRLTRFARIVRAVRFHEGTFRFSRFINIESVCAAEYFPLPRSTATILHPPKVRKGDDGRQHRSPRYATSLFLSPSPLSGPMAAGTRWRRPQQQPLSFPPPLSLSFSLYFLYLLVHFFRLREPGGRPRAAPLPSVFWILSPSFLSLPRRHRLSHTLFICQSICNSHSPFYIVDT